MSRPTDERLERHALPQATLKTPLFAGVEAPVLAFEAAALGMAVHLTGLRWLPVAVIAGAVLLVHLGLARATRADRRLTQVAARSLAYPRSARPVPTFATGPVAAAPSFPRRPLP